MANRYTRAELLLIFTAAALVFSRVFGLSLVLPNFREHFDGWADPVLIGTAFSVYGITMAAMQLPWGELSDRIGRRPVLFLSSLLFVAGSIVCWQADSIGWLIGGRLLQGMGAIGSVAMAAVGDTIPASRRTFAMAMVGIPAGMGFLAGIAIGPALYPTISMDGLFLLTAAIGVAGMAPLAWVRIAPPPLTAVAALPEERRATVRALAFGALAANVVFTTTLFFLPTTDALVLGPMLLAAFLVVGGVARRVDKKGGLSPVAVAFILLGAAAPLFALAPGNASLWLAGIVFFSAHASLMSMLPSHVSRIAGARGGRGHGIQNVVGYLGTAAAGPIAGALSGSPWIAFTVAGLAAFVAAAALLRVPHAPKAS